jgi:hypothetical protein
MREILSELLPLRAPASDLAEHELWMRQDEAGQFSASIGGDVDDPDGYPL